MSANISFELEILSLANDFCDLCDSEGFVWRFHAATLREFSLRSGECSYVDLCHAAVAESLLSARLDLKKLICGARRSSEHYAKKLMEKGHGAQDTALAIDIARLQGLIGDYSYAAYLLDLRHTRRRDGVYALRRWLLGKGFAPDLVNEALAAREDASDPLADALFLLANRTRLEERRARAQSEFASPEAKGLDPEGAERERRARRGFSGGEKRFKAGDAPPDDESPAAKFEQRRAQINAELRAQNFLLRRGYDGATAARAVRRFFAAADDWD